MNKFIAFLCLLAGAAIGAPASINQNPWTTNNAIVASNITASLLTGGTATNSISVAAGTNAVVLTNVLLRTISALTDTNVVNSLAGVQAQNATNTTRLAANLAATFDALGAAQNATNTTRLATQLAGSFDALNAGTTAAQNATNAGNLAFLTATQHFSGNNQFSGSNNYTGTLLVEGAMRVDDGSLIATNMTARTNGGGSWALTTYGPIIMDGVRVANTNLVTTQKAGLVPKFPNDATYYFDGTGNYSIPTGGTGQTNDAILIAGSQVSIVTNGPTGGKTTYTIASTATGAGAPWATVVSAGDATVTVVTNSASGTNNYTLSLSGSGINAATATNIAAYQALLATNSLIGAQNNWTASNYFGAGLGGNISSTTASIGTANITNAYGLISRGNVTNQSGFRIAYLDDTNSLYSSFLPLAGGTVSGPITTTSATSNAPSTLELTTAGWVRSLFNVGLIDYATSNIDNTATNPATLNQVVYTFWQGVIPQSSVQTWPSGFITNNGYIGAVITTNTFSVVDGTIAVNAYIGATTAGPLGNYFLTMHPEIYYSYDKTNWYGDYIAQPQSITGNATNLYSWVVTFPAITSTNQSGFYIQRRLRVDTASTAGNVPTVYFMVGTNAVSGTANASHTSMSGPNSALGNAYLGNNQTFTGTNTFTVGTRTFLHDSAHTLITNTATLTSSEWTSGSQKEWYNGATMMTIDKTNGLITANGYASSTNGVLAGQCDFARHDTTTNASGAFSLSVNIANVPTTANDTLIMHVKNTGSTFAVTTDNVTWLNSDHSATHYVTNGHVLNIMVTVQPSQFTNAYYVDCGP